jgi:group I intron endonuclease
MENRPLHYYIVYKTINLINSKFYVGVHKISHKKDTYLGSGKLLKKAIKKYGKENFVRETLYSFNSESKAYKKEKELVNLEFVQDKNTYNVTEGGNIPPKATLQSTNKALETKVKKYGSKMGTLHTDEIRAKVLENSLKKYGSVYGFLNNETSRLKREKTLINRYGKLAGQMHTKIVIYTLETGVLLWRGPLKGVNKEFTPQKTFYRNKKTIRSVNKYLIGDKKYFKLGGLKCIAEFIN